MRVVGSAEQSQHQIIDDEPVSQHVLRVFLTDIVRIETGFSCCEDCGSQPICAVQRECFGPLDLLDEPAVSPD